MPLGEKVMADPNIPVPPSAHPPKPSSSLANSSFKQLENSGSFEERPKADASVPISDKENLRELDENGNPKQTEKTVQPSQKKPKKKHENRMEASAQANSN